MDRNTTALEFMKIALASFMAHKVKIPNATLVKEAFALADEFIRQGGK